ncbi:NF-kappa-B-repressing factor [Holothuria leucospilota]|uniref:NF-kappa-B-repressing factor n=1 Tax=Holothuria leucospilota TaxID=206669 RepID=A0A9Q1BIP6_HOLLE|nr:NF-kappa-B-repressing factor [Holothuria leucospilota]
MDSTKCISDKLRLEHESDNQWKIRKEFLLKNATCIKDIGINRLVSLSMTWSNTVFLGCRYPPELLERLTKMSEGITVDTLNYTINKTLESSFHAEGEPPNGTKRKFGELDQPERTSSKKKRKKESNALGTFQQVANSTDLFDTRDVPADSSESCFQLNNRWCDDDTSIIGSTTWLPQKDFKIPTEVPVRLEEGMVQNFKHLYKLLGQFVIIKHERASPISVIVDSANLNKMDITFNFECESPTDHSCSIFIGNVFVGKGSGITKKIAKSNAAENVFNMMKDVFPVVTKTCLGESMLHLSDEIKVADICKGDPTENMKQENKERENDEFKEISESNVGHKLLQKMGWSGGGLGKDGQGRKNPVPVEQRPNRAGLGIDLTQYEDKEGRLLTVKMDRKLISKLLAEVADGTREHLVFSSLLSKEQRSFIHSASVKYGLKSQSYGKGSDRFLTIQRKMSKTDLLQSAQRGSAFLTLEGSQKSK